MDGINTKDTAIFVKEYNNIKMEYEDIGKYRDFNKRGQNCF